ncbi:unnamed protein product [Ascophyllum nodosum]
MESLALVDFSSGGSERRGLARSDPNMLPLGAVLGTSSAGGSASGGAGAPAPRPLLIAGGRPKLPPPPRGQPLMVLLPETRHVALFLVPTAYLTLLSGALMLLALLGSSAWGWGLASPSGLASGVTAGVAVGLWVRSWPVGGWTSMALATNLRLSLLPRINQMVLGFGVLGGGWPSVGLGIALGLATLWQHGWWLYLHPECAPLLALVGTTVDVSLGILLASVFQVHLTPKTPPTTTGPSSLQPPANEAVPRTPRGLGAQWTPVTPPGMVGSRSRGRM